MHKYNYLIKSIRGDGETGPQKEKIMKKITVEGKMFYIFTMACGHEVKVREGFVKCFPGAFKNFETKPCAKCAGVEPEKVEIIY